MLLANLQHSPELFISLVFLLGLMVGSFLNVVIYRLPLMMHRNWRRECLEYLALPTENQSENVNLLFPGSRCPHCKSPIKAYQNIPVISYLLMGGKCANCAARISIRYPFVEAFTGVCSAAVAWRFGLETAVLFALLLSWSLIVLSFIDIDQQLLPDTITLSLLWLGLLLSLFPIFADSHSSITGAVTGYLSLWCVYHLFKLLTGKEGMGYGDFKLLAMLGAWLGWQYLPLIILLASLTGAIVGFAMIAAGKHSRSQPIPFGPYLAAAGWLALLYGDTLNNLYLNAVGL